MTVLCLGEAIVDLLCESPVASLEQAERFRPHFGGAMANVAVATRRAGTECALFAGVGDDPWGRWLHDRLREEGVDLRWFGLAPGIRTPLAFVTFDHEGEPRFHVYGEAIEAGLDFQAERLGAAIDSASALVFSSNTLVGKREREITLAARRRALGRGVRVCFDPNIRDHRWHDLEVALDFCRRICEGSFCVRTNLREARLITGSEEPADAARELSRLGARIAVVTLGPGGALVRGEAEGQVPAPRVDVVSPLGAGDAFMGGLLAGLAERGWDGSRAAEALPAAVEVGTRACTRWGAI